MHPVSTLLFLLGYGLALPIAFRFGFVFSDRRNLAIRGYQVGLLLAALGWLLKGRLVIAVLHIAWIIVIRLWFAARRTGGRRPARPDSSV